MTQGMLFRLMPGLFAGGLLIWGALQFKPLPSNWLIIDLTDFKLSSALEKQLPEPCIHNTELMLLQFQLDFEKLANLKQSLRQLHDKNQDAFYQPLLDVVEPKTMGLDPITLKPTDAHDAVQIHRRARRLEFHFGNYPSPDVFTLIYDLTVEQSGEIVLAEHRSNLSQTSLPLVALQDPNDHSGLNGEAYRITDCAAAALPLLRSDLSWQYANISGKKYCLLQGRTTEQVQMKFLASCPTPRLSMLP